MDTQQLKRTGRLGDKPVYRVNGKGRDCSATVADGFVYYVKIMYGCPGMTATRKPRLYYGRVIEADEDTITFEPLKAAEYRAAKEGTITTA